MKKVLNKIYLIVFIFSLAYLVSSCTPGQILPEPVCEYGSIACEFSELLCQEIPSTCWYVNFACTNLQLLCDSTLTPDQRELVLDALEKNNNLLKIQLQKVKK